MYTELLQSTNARVLMKLYLAGTGTPATGKTVSVTISKNGATFANPSGGPLTATEVGSGWYYADLTTTDSGALGPLIVLGTASGCDNADRAYNVVKATNRGATGIPDAVAAASGGLLIVGSGSGAINPSSGNVTVAGYAAN